MTFTVNAQDKNGDNVHLIYTLSYEDSYTRLSIKKEDINEAVCRIVVSSKSETPVIAGIPGKSEFAVVYNRVNDLFTTCTEFRPDDIMIEYR